MYWTVCGSDGGGSGSANGMRVIRRFELLELSRRWWREEDVGIRGPMESDVLPSLLPPTRVK